MFEYMYFVVYFLTFQWLKRCRRNRHRSLYIIHILSLHPRDGFIILINQGNVEETHTYGLLILILILVP